MNGKIWKILPWSLGQNFSNFFIHILGNATTSCYHSEIYWPLDAYILQTAVSCGSSYSMYVEDLVKYKHYSTSSLSFPATYVLHNVAKFYESGFKLHRYLKSNFFKKQHFSSSFLLTWSKYTGPNWPWSTEHASSVHLRHGTETPSKIFWLLSESKPKFNFSHWSIMTL